VNASTTYALRSQVQLYAQIQNLLNRHYIADNSGRPPILGTPLELFAGMRLTL